MIKTLKAIFYWGINFTFLAILFVRYYNYLNGYLVVLPAVISILALLILTIKDEKSIKKIAFTWGYLFILIVITAVTINFF